jgi:hypothetical protein
MTSCPEPHILIDAAYGHATDHDAHIAACPTCQDEIRELRSTLGALKELPSHSADHVPVRIPVKRPIPYGAIAATILVLATFLIGLRIEISADGRWSLQFGVPRSVQVASAPAVTPEMLASMQAEQLAAMRRMIDEVRAENDTAVETLIRDYVTLTETRRSLDYQLIRYEIEDLKERTDDQLYRSNLAMHDLLSQLSYANQTD